MSLLGFASLSQQMMQQVVYLSVHVNLLVATCERWALYFPCVQSVGSEVVGGGVWGDPPRGRHWWGRCFFWVGFGIATREMLPPGGHVDVTHELQIGRVVNNIVVVSQGPWSSCRKWSSSNILRPLFTRLCKIKSWQESGAQAAFVSPPTFVKLMFCHIKVNDTKGTGLAAYSQQRTTVTRGSSHGRGTFGNTVIMLWAFSRVLFFIGHSIFVQLCGIKLAACYKGAHP